MVNITPPAAFRPSDNPDTHRTEGWLGLRADLGVLEKGKKYLVLPEVEIRIVQSAARSLNEIRHSGFSSLLLHESRPQLY